MTTATAAGPAHDPETIGRAHMSIDNGIGPLFQPAPAGPTVQRRDSVAAESAAAAWDSVASSGWAADTLRTVFRVIHQIGPATRDEIDRRCHELDKVQPSKGQSTYVRRLYELKRLGVVTEWHERRRCAVLAKDVTAYRITGKGLPDEKPPKAVGRPEAPAQRLQEGREAAAELLGTEVDLWARSAVDALDALIEALRGAA